MARGYFHQPNVKIREEQSQHLLNRLATATEPEEREGLIEEIVSLNLALCEALTNRYVGRGVERDDLVQVARLALLLAVQRYRLDAGRPFPAFAVPTIIGELRRHFRDHGWMVRPPRQVQELRVRAREAVAELEQQLGRSPDTSELVDELEVAADDLRECRMADNSYRPWSLDVTPDGHVESLGSTVADAEDFSDRVLDRLTLSRALATLDDRDRVILAWRFRDECSQQMIADRLGISQMSVSRLLRQLLAELRQAFLAEPEPTREGAPQEAGGGAVTRPLATLHSAA